MTKSITILFAITLSIVAVFRKGQWISNVARSSLEGLENGNSTCDYCGRNIEGDSNFCNKGCEEEYKV